MTNSWQPRIPYRNIPNDKGLSRWTRERFGDPFPKGWVGNRFVTLDPELSKDGLNVELTPQRRAILQKGIYDRRRESHSKVTEANRKMANPMNWATPQMMMMFGDELNKAATKRLISGQIANISPNQLKDLGSTKKRVTNRELDKLFKAEEAEIGKSLAEHEAFNTQSREDFKNIPLERDKIPDVTGDPAIDNKSRKLYQTAIETNNIITANEIDAAEKATFEIPLSNFEKAGRRQSPSKGSVSRNQYQLKKRKYDAAAGTGETIMNDQPQTIGDRTVIGWKMSDPPEPIYATTGNSIKAIPELGDSPNLDPMGSMTWSKPGVWEEGILGDWNIPKYPTA